MFDNSLPACAFFFKVEISLRKLIPLFRPGSVHSGSASWDYCNRLFHDELLVSSFPDRFPHCLDNGIVGPLRLRWVKGVCVFRCNLPPALLGNDRFFCVLFLRATAVTRGWNGHRIRVSTQSWLRKRKFSRRSCRDSNSQPFDHESGTVPTSYTEARPKCSALKGISLNPDQY